MRGSTNQHKLIKKKMEKLVLGKFFFLNNICHSSRPIICPNNISCWIQVTCCKFSFAKTMERNKRLGNLPLQTGKQATYQTLQLKVTGVKRANLYCICRADKLITLSQCRLRLRVLQ